MILVVVLRYVEMLIFLRIEVVVRKVLREL